MPDEIPAQTTPTDHPPYARLALALGALGYLEGPLPADWPPPTGPQVTFRHPLASVAVFVQPAETFPGEVGLPATVTSIMVTSLDYANGPDGRRRWSAHCDGATPLHVVRMLAECAARGE